MTPYRAQRSSPRRSTLRGFTLIELMITVAIVAILARVALPAYLDYAKRGKLTEAFNQLSGASLSMAQFYQDNRTYVGATCPSATSNFTYSCTLAATSYTITAAGITTSSVNGFSFTLTDAGVRATTAAPSGWKTSASCWVSNRSGTCQ